MTEQAQRARTASVHHYRMRQAKYAAGLTHYMLKTITLDARPVSAGQRVGCRTSHDC